MEVLPISNKELQINEQIRDKELRVVDSDGTQLGIMPLKQALELAEQRDLDLVKIAPQAKPPVCKIIDYGKFRFEQSKREKEQRKNQRIVEIKEVRLSLNIDTHDFETKKNHALRFIAEGNKVKASHPLPRQRDGPPRAGAGDHGPFRPGHGRGGQRGEACQAGGADHADVPCPQAREVKQNHQGGLLTCRN